MDVAAVTPQVDRLLADKRHEVTTAAFERRGDGGGCSGWATHGSRPLGIRERAMGADNWAVCPRCLQNAEREKNARTEELRDAYGVLPIEEFDALRAIAEQPIDHEKLLTYREDYEIGILDGDPVFFIRYRGGCKTCGLTHRVESDERLAL